MIPISMTDISDINVEYFKIYRSSAFQIQLLVGYIKWFKCLLLFQVKDNVEYVPGDLIVEKPDSHFSSAYKQRRGSILALTAACVVGVAVASRLIQRPVTIGYVCKWQF